MGGTPGRRIPVRIRIEDEKGFERTVLFEKSLLRIGSGPDSDLELDHSRIAPCHLVILREGEGFAFADTSGGLTTCLNDRPALKGPLTHGDVLSFGSECPFRITFLTKGIRRDDGTEQKLRTLLDASKAINSSLVLEDVLDRVMDSAITVTGAEKGFLILVEPDGSLKPKAARNIDRTTLDEKTLPASRSLIDKAISERRSVRYLASEAPLDSRSTSIMRLELDTVMCTPIISREEVIGVIYLDHHGVIRDLSGAEQEIVEALAGHASVAIENARLTERTLLSERLTVLGRMVSSIVHDLRGPLAGIRAAAQYLSSSGGEAKASRMLGLIMDEVDRMSEMTQEVLEFCRGEISLHLSEWHLESFLKEFAEKLCDEMEGHPVEVALDLEKEARVRLDKRRMERVLRNLIRNALDAMPEGGRLTLRSRLDGRLALVSVGDTGCGMTEAVRRRSFEPFFTSGKGNGTGLGMAIAQRVVEAHSGRIEVESSPGEGTTVRILLPARPARKEALETRPMPAGARSD